MKNKKISFIAKMIGTLVVITGLMFNIYSPVSTTTLTSASRSPIIIYNAYYPSFE